MNKYNELLKVFTSEDEVRIWMNDPFREDQHAIATDAYSMAIVPFEKTEDVKDKGDFHPTYPVISVVPYPSPKGLFLSVDDLVKELAKYEKEQDTKECDRCGGEGYDDERHDDNGLFCACEHCDGTGEVLIDSYSHSSIKFLKLGNSQFSLWNLEKLAKAAEIMGIKGRIEVTHQNLMKHPTTFQIEDVTIVLMPIMNDDVMRGIEGELFIRKEDYDSL